MSPPPLEGGITLLLPRIREAKTGLRAPCAELCAPCTVETGGCLSLSPPFFWSFLLPTPHAVVLLGRMLKPSDLNLTHSPPLQTPPRDGSGSSLRLPRLPSCLPGTRGEQVPLLLPSQARKPAPGWGGEGLAQHHRGRAPLGQSPDS